MTNALAEALRKIVSSEPRASLPWTHEAAADEYMRVIYNIKTTARAALAAYDAAQESQSAPGFDNPITKVCLVNCGRPPVQCACLGGNPYAMPAYYAAPRDFDFGKSFAATVASFDSLPASSQLDYYRAKAKADDAAPRDAGYVAGLEAALRPFADAWPTVEASIRARGLSEDATTGWRIKAKHIRAAAAAIRALPPPAAAPDLTDPVVVHTNMLRGTIAKPTLDQIIHIYGIDALCKALAPEIVREAEAQLLAAAPRDAVSGAPERIWAVDDGAFIMAYDWPNTAGGATEYVRADLALPPPAAETAWVPPEDRPYNFECLGWIYGGWDFVFWVDDHWQTRKSNRCNPAAFSPLPPAPFPSAQEPQP